MIFNKIKQYLQFNPPSALTFDEWKQFKKDFKEKAPIRYLIKNMTKLIRRLNRRYNNMIWWVKYRTTHRYHKIWTGLEPGWNDLTTSMLHANFQMLVDFVEIEKASCQQVSRLMELSKWERFKDKFHRYPKRSEADGLEHLEWEISLGDESPAQAKSALEILMLYKWWKHIRPFRKQRETKFPENTERDLLSLFSETWRINNPDAHEEFMKSLDASRKLDEAYDTIDEVMLIRLMKIRKHLWT